MTQKLDYGVVIPWPTLKEHLEKKVAETAMQLETCALGDVDRYRGTLAAYRSLLNLPGTLQFLGDFDQEESEKKNSV